MRSKSGGRNESRVSARVDLAVLIIPYVLITFAFLKNRTDISSCDQVDGSLKSCFQLGDNCYVATDGRVITTTLVGACSVSRTSSCFRDSPDGRLERRSSGFAWSMPPGRSAASAGPSFASYRF